MITLDGVPIATYGLTGMMIIALTGLTFFVPKGEQGEVASVIATASVPDFMGNALTPTAPSFMDTATSATTVAMDATTAAMSATTAAMSATTAAVGATTAAVTEEPSTILRTPIIEPSTILGSPIAANKEEPTTVGSLAEETSKFIQNREEQEEPTPIARFGGNNKNKKNKNKTRRRK